MKATIDIPDDLYRRVKAKSAMERQPVRQVAVNLFHAWLGDSDLSEGAGAALEAAREYPAWFGGARKHGKRVQHHDMAAIRRSIARGRSREESNPASPTGEKPAS